MAKPTGETSVGKSFIDYIGAKERSLIKDAPSNQLAGGKRDQDKESLIGISARELKLLQAVNSHLSNFHADMRRLQT